MEAEAEGLQLVEIDHPHLGGDSLAERLAHELLSEAEDAVDAANHDYQQSGDQEL